jgi:hypothetical protein
MLKRDKSSQKAWANASLSSKQLLRETDQARHALLQTQPHGADRRSDSMCSWRQSDQTQSWTCLRAHAVYLRLV